MLQTLSKNDTICAIVCADFIMSNYQKDLKAWPSNERQEWEWIKVYKPNPKKNLWLCSPYPRWIGKKFNYVSVEGFRKLLLEIESNIVTLAGYCKERRQGFTWLSPERMHAKVQEFSSFGCRYVELELNSEVAAHYVRAVCTVNEPTWLE